jgi:probable HAF family extracellular repeat protein
MFEVWSISRVLGSKRYWNFGVGFLGLALVAAGTARAGVAMYTATPLGYLPGDVYSHVSGINNSGQVLGTSYDSSGNGRAFAYDASGIHLIGPGPGARH